MDEARLRAWWWHRQGLDGGLDRAAPATVLARTGWSRSQGGANPYLALLARAGTSRAEVDEAAADFVLYEVPAAAGLRYVLPAEHFGLGLHMSRTTAEAEVHVLRTLGVRRSEVERLCAEVLQALDAGIALNPKQLKDVLGDSVRNLGTAGKRVGAPTTLPAALILLESAGEIRRVFLNGRLDQQRYRYTRWQPPSSGLTDHEAWIELARLYFEWAAPATIDQFRLFAGLRASQAMAAVAELDLVELGHELLVPPDMATDLVRYRPAGRPRYALLDRADPLLWLRRDLPTMLLGTDVNRPLPGRTHPLRQANDLPDHMIVDRGRVIGLWQYDAEFDEIAWWLFDSGRPDRLLATTIERTQRFIRIQLGDARASAQDSPKSRAHRIAALRSARAGFTPDHWFEST